MEVAEHSLRMKEFSGSARFSMRSRSASCPPKRSGKAGAVAPEEEMDEWVLVGKPENPGDAELDWRPHPKHRRAVSDVHCTRGSHSPRISSTASERRTRRVHFSVDGDSISEPPVESLVQTEAAQVSQTVILAGTNSSA